MTGHARCLRPAVAALRRRHGKGFRWWAYCERHLYGRVLHDGALWLVRMVATPTLTVRERALIDFARAHPHAATGPVERLMREQLGVSPTRYWQELNVLLGRREALEYDAQTVHRLERVREARRSRAGR